MKILAFDSETGGLDPKEASILTAYFAVTDENFNIIDSLNLKLKPDDDLIKANPEALKVNKIDLDTHKSEAITYSEARKQLIAFFKKHTNGERLTPLAHNIEFDLSFVYEHLVPRKEWDQYITYHKLDTVGIANFFKLAGWIDKRQSVSLGKLAELLEIKFDGDAHTAEADVKMCVEVLKKFVEGINE